jgi:hypothetical protein
MANTKDAVAPKSKAQAVREAIETLLSQKRDITVAAVLALLQSQGVKNAKPIDVYQSETWKALRDKEKAATAAAATPAASAPPSGGITKTQAVKQAFARLGSDAKPAAVIDYVKKTHGLDVSPQTVSNLKALQAKRPATAKRRGRPPKEQAKRAPAHKATPAKSTGGISLDDIRAVKELAARIGAEKLAQLAEVLA